MSPRSSDDSEANRRPPETAANEESPVDTTVEKEVTRVDSVTYLEGASGHAVLSLGFLLAALVLARRDSLGASVVAVVVAYGVALNGLSIYAWNELRASFASVFDSDEGETGRTLTPHTVSTEMKAELLTGLTMVGGFAVCLAVALGTIRTAGTQVTTSLSVGALAVGNLAALGWTYHFAA